MDGHSLPGRAGGTLEAYRPRKTKNAEPDVTDQRAFCKCARLVQVRRCLPPDIWAWLAWEAAGNTGGYLP